MIYFMVLSSLHVITPERSGLVSAVRTQIPAANYMFMILKYLERNHIPSINPMPVNLALHPPLTRKQDPDKNIPPTNLYLNIFFLLVVCRLQEQEQELNLAIKEATAKVSHFSCQLSSI